MSSAARRGTPLRTAGRMATTLAAIATFLLAGVVLLPGLLGMERYVITGGSMSGTFERGAVVLAQVVPVADLAVGDVITYLPPADSGISELVTHRIDSIDESAAGPVFRTRGDANSAADSWTFQLSSPTQARVEVAVPHVGWAFIALADKDLRMLIIGVPAALIALMSVVEVTRVLSEPRKPTARPVPVAVAG